MAEFISGITEKYPAPLLKGRLNCEGNVCACLMKDMLLIDDVKLSGENFLTSDGLYYFTMLSSLRKQGYSSLDEVTILSNLNENMIEQYEDRGGWSSIQHLIDIINIDNFNVYLDKLYRENVLINLYDDGFNLMKEIKVGEKKIIPLKLLRKMTSEEVLDWYDARLTSYGVGYSNKIMDKEVIKFDDQFIQECKEGIEQGVPIDLAGLDINLEDINCLPFLSRQIMGLMDGTLTMIGGYSSSGKSTLLVTIIMALLNYDRKIVIVSNEERIQKFKVKFLVWILGKYNRYYKLSKKKLMAGDINEDSMKQLKIAQEYWNENFGDRVKFVSINDSDMATAKKEFREAILREGYDVFIYDTFKIQESDMSNSRQDLALVRDSRDLDKLAKKYNVIGIATVQLSESTRGQLFLGAQNLSNSKQIKEILENLLLMRNLYREELDPKSKYYCKPYRLKKIGNKWVEESYELDPSRVYKVLFVTKSRNGSNSEDTGSAYILDFLGDFSIFKEVAQGHMKHGTIV